MIVIDLFLTQVSIIQITLAWNSLSNYVNPIKRINIITWIVWIVKNLPAMQETWVWSLGQVYPLKEGMATQSSLLAWRIPWTEKPGRLQSMGPQRVRHDWGTNTWIQLLGNLIFNSIVMSTRFKLQDFNLTIAIFGYYFYVTSNIWIFPNTINLNLTLILLCGYW